VVTIVRTEIIPPGPTVGTNYQVHVEIHSKETGIVRGRIEVPGQDRVTSQNPAEVRVSAGLGAIFVFNVYCGESGGRVRSLVEFQRPPTAPAVAPVGLEPTRNGRTVNSSLADTDPKDSARTTSFAKVFPVRMRKGQSYVIDMVSTQFDPFLRLENAAGQQLAQDDDSGGFPNARIVYIAPEDGTYRVIGTSFSPATGGFTLLIREQ
jgi:hypothetical protein